MTKNFAFDAIDSKKLDFEKLALDLWDHPETAFNEVHANRAVCDLARALGFEVKSPAFGMPTALEATYTSGEGGPVFGFLGEFDALPGLSQKHSTKKEPLVEGGPGHGCGHNLLCVAPLAAAYGVKEYLRQTGKPGKVIYYGCPAEEQLIGKGFMARGGAFKDLDIALAWHGMSGNSAGFDTMTGSNSATFHFHGRTAHAGYDPHNGRSALDAVELMNVGANYLREHVTSDVRIHYVIKSGGTAPNIVPDYAASWYFVRALSRDTIEDTYERLVEIARGAAQMTGTNVEVEFHGGCYNTMPNRVLVDLAHECMTEIGSPKWTEEEKEFAREMNRNSPIYDPAKHDAEPIAEHIPPIVERIIYGSTDVGDVQHIVPGVMITTATTSSASPGHSWLITSCAGGSIGLKGMFFGAESLSLAAIKMIEDPSIIERAKKEFDEKMHGRSYKCPVTDDLKVPDPKQ